MFGKLKELQGQLDELKREVHGPKDKSPKSFWPPTMLDMFCGFPRFARYTLKERVDDLQKILKQQEKLTHLILEHMGLEYVKVTEESGDKKVVEKLRPISKKKSERKKMAGDCECCSYAD
jgi:hypothetical protein